MENCVDLFPEMPRICNRWRDERWDVYSLSLHDKGMIEVGNCAKVFEVFSRVKARPDTFKMTFRKFHFSQKGREQRNRRLSAKDFALKRSMFIENMRQGGVTTFNKFRKTSRRFCDKTRRENVMTKLSHIDRGDSTKEAFDTWSTRRWNDVERTNDGKVICRRNRLTSESWW